MMIQVPRPTCKKVLKAPPTAARRVTNCPGCGMRVEVTDLPTTLNDIVSCEIGTSTADQEKPYRVSALQFGCGSIFFFALMASIIVRAYPNTTWITTFGLVAVAVVVTVWMTMKEIISRGTHGFAETRYTWIRSAFLSVAGVSFRHVGLECGFGQARSRTGG